MFQFALPHGERQGLKVEMPQLVDVSIRAPAWGATFGVAAARGGAGVSIRAPAWGATLAAGAQQNGEQRFNSRSRMGSDR